MADQRQVHPLRQVNKSLEAQFQKESDELGSLANLILRSRETWWGSHHNGTEYHFSTVNTGNFTSIYLNPDLQHVALQWMLFFGTLAIKRGPDFGPCVDVMIATLDIVEEWRWGSYAKRFRDRQRGNYWNWGSNKWDGWPAVNTHELCDAGTVPHRDGCEREAVEDQQHREDCRAATQEQRSLS